MPFDAVTTNPRGSDTGSALEFKSLSTHDLQMMVDSEIQGVSNIIGLEVRRPPPCRGWINLLTHSLSQRSLLSYCDTFAGTSTN